MRACFLLVSIFVSLAGCAAPRVLSVHYSPPSAAPVRAAVAHAQDHARQVKQDIADARGTHDKAALGLVLDDANGEVDQLTAALLDAQTATADFEKKVEEQTTLLNTCGDQKNEALLERDRANTKAGAASGKLWRTRALLLAAVAWILRGPILALGKVIIGLVAKI